MFVDLASILSTKRIDELIYFLLSQVVVVASYGVLDELGYLLTAQVAASIFVIFAVNRVKSFAKLYSLGSLVLIGTAPDAALLT